MRISEAGLQKTFHVNLDSKYKDVHICMKNIYSVIAEVVYVPTDLFFRFFFFFSLWAENKTVTGKLN